MKQTLPYSFNLEITEGCCLDCDFCGVWVINRYRKARNESRYHYMSVEFARKFARALRRWMGDNHARRFEFEMHGEPLLNPHAVDIIAVFRSALPKAQLMITTNTLPILKDFSAQADALFHAGLNYLVCDAYGEQRERIHHIVKTYASQHPAIPLHDLFEENWSVFSYRGYGEQGIVFQDDLAAHQTAQKNVRKRMHNQGGDIDFKRAKKFGITPLDKPLVKMCAIPFRKFVMHFDGTVSICCLGGWRRQGVIGKFPEESPGQIWRSDGFNAVRALLKRKERRSIVPCNVCDHFGGFRVGLTVDPFPGETVKDLQLLYQLHKYRYQKYIYNEVIE